jgi:hypothetical protein
VFDRSGVIAERSAIVIDRTTPRRDDQLLKGSFIRGDKVWCRCQSDGPQSEMMGQAELRATLVESEVEQRDADQTALSDRQNLNALGERPARRVPAL